mgnify:CR=1 FL=1|jgi:hypothetical protein
MGLDMVVHEIHKWEKQELNRFMTAIRAVTPTIDVNNSDSNNIDFDTLTLKNPTIPVPYQIGKELCYWRKHPDLHGWMKNLFFEKGGETESDFNHDVVWLTVKDVLNLKDAIKNDNLPKTSGFFFGNSDGRLKITDIEKADMMLDALSKGSSIYYTSSW